MSYSFNQVFLPAHKFPSDPNRGFEVPSAIVSYESQEPCEIHQLASTSPILVNSGLYCGRRVKIFSPSLIISMPLPDFSMPYNVIAFTSTAFVFFINGLILLVVKDIDITSSGQDIQTKRRRKILNFCLVFVLGIALLHEYDRDLFDKTIRKLVNES